ncbi:MAG: CZB domain-containing protein [Betaproteobacteria bacterium]|nr:CZB domain-containing protein [Betaproteobacteria bacterium]
MAELPDVCVTADKLTLRAATRSHQRWMATAVQTLEGEALPEDDARSFHPCRFGHWLRSSGGAHYGVQSTFLLLCQQHDAVHHIVDELLALARTDRMDDLRHRLPELSVASDSIVVLIDLLMAEGEGCSVCESQADAGTATFKLP